ncbi:hypothetical protein C0J52_06871, partial [Blattella germanica]
IGGSLRSCPENSFLFLLLVNIKVISNVVVRVTPVGAVKSWIQENLRTVNKQVNTISIVTWEILSPLCPGCDIVATPGMLCVTCSFKRWLNNPLHCDDQLCDQASSISHCLE